MGRRWGCRVNVGGRGDALVELEAGCVSKDAIRGY